MKLGTLTTYALVALLCGACSDPSDQIDDVSGRWCGSAVASAEACLGDEVIYLDLTQSGASVSGEACEAFEKECYPVTGATFREDKLVFSYEFSSGSVDGHFSADGPDTLSGTLHASKCDCDIPKTLHRVP